MEFSSILWGVAFLVTSAFLAWGTVLMSFSEMRLAIVLFSLAPIPMVIMDIIYVATTSDSFPKRFVVSGVIGAISLTATLEQIRFATKRGLKK